MKMEFSYSFLRERNIIVLILCRILWGLTQALFIPYFSLFALAQKGVTPELLGITVSIRAVGAAILSPMAGQLADSIGRKKMIFAGTTLHTSSYLFYVIATDSKMILVGSLMEGLSTIHLPALLAITHDSLIQGKRGLGLSATFALQSLPSIISPLIGGILAERLGIDTGMRIGFSLAFGAGLVVAFIRLKFLTETAVGTIENARAELKSPLTFIKKSYKDMLKLLREYKALQGLIILSAVDTFFGAIAAPFWVVYAKTFVGLNTAEWGLIETTATGVSVMTLLFSGNLVDRFGRKKTLLLNLLLAPIVNLSFIFCQNFTHILLFRIFLTIQNAFIVPAAVAIFADIVPIESRGRGIAAVGAEPVIMTLIGHVPPSGFFRVLPSFGGSVLSGYLFDLDARYPWLLLSAGYALEFIICLFFIKEGKKPAD